MKQPVENMTKNRVAVMSLGQAAEGRLAIGIEFKGVGRFATMAIGEE